MSVIQQITLFLFGAAVGTLLVSLAGYLFLYYVIRRMPGWPTEDEFSDYSIYPPPQSSNGASTAVSEEQS